MTPVVLLVDDDDAFKVLVDHAFKKSGLQASLQYVPDGQEAMHYLSRTGETNYPFPALVLLDLKMPRVDGYEVLEWKCSRPELSKLPFVVLSYSDLEKDRERAASLGAHAYLVKPMDMAALARMVAGLGEFWAARS